MTSAETLAHRSAAHDIVAAARARHDAMSPARRALADVGADVYRLVVIAPSHEIADRALGQARVPRAVWRFAAGPEALRGHAPGAPVLWLEGTEPAMPDPSVAAEMRSMIDARRMVRVEVDDAAAVLGEP